MRWSPGGGSRNVEDRRGSGGMGMAPMGIGGAIVLLVLSLVFGRDFVSNAPVDSGTQKRDSAAGEVGQVQQTPEEAKEVQFVEWVLDTTQATWSRVMPEQLGARWHDAKLVLFRGATRTACGVGQTAMGPFYCPLDEKVYVDLSFYDELKQRFGAPGDFAQAYVLAHELGHHVQHLLGTDAKVRRFQQANPDEANHASVLLELQADCYAGVWGHYAEAGGALDPGDVEEGLNAAAAVGDDRMQRQAGRQVNMDSFTHGSSAQRE
ncbi:MAG: KPN_02809 family neutral zinc metallopeptidase, partial [bacterium]